MAEDLAQLKFVRRADVYKSGEGTIGVRGIKSLPPRTKYERGLMIPEMVVVAAQSPTLTDYTPAAIGLIGTLIGASIGLAFNSFAHKEQKRRHINEKVVELLRRTDAIRTSYTEVFNDARKYGDGNETNAGTDRRKMVNTPHLNIAMSETREARIVLDYIRLTADPTTAWLAREVTDCSRTLLVAIKNYVEKDRPVQRAYLQNYGETRNALISHLAPKSPAPNGPRLLAARFSRWAARHRTSDSDTEADDVVEPMEFAGHASSSPTPDTSDPA
ncbi:hypothetical protein [Paenarthrobacter nicotinovorans]|uniref:hypothetical protein n=1 Tax=Paenarthrobacter nicotinovorans TaxID=29320 RepID=UPI0011A98CCA|nr:hypothetical protein [Paenarthrobacter nicotinovorans]